MDTQVRRTVVLQVRTRPHELAAVRRAAELEHVTVSELVRTALAAYVARIMSGKR